MGDSLPTRRSETAVLADEQAALRRVATLVARGVSAPQVFAAVAEELAQLLDASITKILRYEPDGTATVVGGWSLPGLDIPIGTRFTLDGTGVVVSVMETGRPSRTERFAGPPGSLPGCFQRLGARTGVGSPVVVDGMLWGVAVAAFTRDEPLAADGEERIGRFTELVATAIANAHAQTELRRVGEEQAALRRVATLVASGASPEKVFSAVAEEVGNVLTEADVTWVGRYESGAIELVAGWTSVGDASFVGRRLILGGHNVASMVFDRKAPTRVDRLVDDAAEATALAVEWAHSAAGAPIVVQGRLWGVMTVGSMQEHGLPGGIEDRLAEFVELVATAIAGAEARSELRALVDEQATLRRVATLVARGEAPEAVFAAVAEAVGRLLPADLTLVGRYDGVSSVTGVGGWSRTGDPTPHGTWVRVGGRNVTTLVVESGRPARLDSYEDASGRAADDARARGIRSSVGAPVSVHGRLWGVVVASSTHGESLPPHAEERLAKFAELVATAIANTQTREELRRVAEEQTALRRVATQVAQGDPPDTVFAAVAAAVGRLLPVDYAIVTRFGPGATATTLGGWARTGEPIVGTTFDLDPGIAATAVLETGRPARIDGYAAVAGAAAAEAVAQGVTGSAAAPIRVDGRVWGAVIASSTGEDPLPPDTEERLADFTEVLATAISSAAAREALRAIADEQAALRRVATLVAHGAGPTEVFSAVTQEVRSVFGAGGAIIVRVELDDDATIVAHVGAHAAELPVGSRWKLEPPLALAEAVRSGRPARTDSYGDTAGGLAEVVHTAGIRSSVACPIVVEGRLWGAIAIGTESDPFPAGTEQRMVDFTELLATAIANAQAHTELTASRARIIASADEARRRIERDLHDGAQQRLVSLALQLRAAQAALPPGLDELSAELDRVAAGLTGALDELREFARGIHPASLAEGGLTRALRTLARRSSVPVALDVRTSGRLPETVEVGAYYVVSEALANVAKHAHASSVSVEVEAADRLLRVTVRDDGVGGAEFAGGSGLVGLKDRVEALGGRIALQSDPGAGTALVVELPLASDPTALPSG